MKFCTQCGETKLIGEFYKKTTAVDGLQPRCKTCCLLNNKNFRLRRPNYYWGGKGEQGYFVKHYDKIDKYNRDYQKANKIGKIYCIETPCGYYIGSTKRHFCSRISDHINDYRHRCNYIPLLHKCFDNYTDTEIYNFIKKSYIIEYCDGTVNELREREKFHIKDFEKKGRTLLNMVYTEKYSKKP